MADNVTKQRRSEIMASVKGVNTKPEMAVRKYLFSKGLRFRLHDKSLPGKPDLKLTKFKCVIFVNGCFWHGHEGCRIYVMPKTNKEFWQLKIDRNLKRDIEIRENLRKIGWKVLIIWECDLKPKKRNETLQALFYSIIS